MIAPSAGTGSPEIIKIIRIWSVDCPLLVTVITLAFIRKLVIPVFCLPTARRGKSASVVIFESLKQAEKWENSVRKERKKHNFLPLASVLLGNPHYNVRLLHWKNNQKT